MEEREHKTEQLLRSRKKFVPKKGQQIKIIGFIICAKRLDFAGWCFWNKFASCVHTE